MTQARIHPTCVIGEQARIGTGVDIGAFTVIGSGAVIEDGATIHSHCFVASNASVGSNAILHPGVTVLDGVRVGRGAVLHSGVVLGADGFGFAKTDEGHHKIPQVGIVEIGDGAIIGANTCIDRATTGRTSVGAGTVLGNLVQLGHNVRIGSGCVLESQVGVAGSAAVEDDVSIGAQAGLAGHITVGRGTVARARSGITKSHPAGSSIAGFPARPAEESDAIDRLIEELPAIVKTLSRKDPQ